MTDDIRVDDLHIEWTDDVIAEEDEMGPTPEPPVVEDPA